MIHPQVASYLSFAAGSSVEITVTPQTTMFAGLLPQDRPRGISLSVEIPVGTMTAEEWAEVERLARDAYYAGTRDEAFAAGARQRDQERRRSAAAVAT